MVAILQKSGKSLYLELIGWCFLLARSKQTVQSLSSHDICWSRLSVRQLASASAIFTRFNNCRQWRYKLCHVWSWSESRPLIFIVTFGSSSPSKTALQNFRSFSSWRVAAIPLRTDKLLIRRWEPPSLVRISSATYNVHCDINNCNCFRFFYNKNIKRIVLAHALPQSE